MVASCSWGKTARRNQGLACTGQEVSAVQSASLAEKAEAQDRGYPESATCHQAAHRCSQSLHLFLALPSSPSPCSAAPSPRSPSPCCEIVIIAIARVVAAARTQAQQATFLSPAQCHVRTSTHRRARYKKLPTRAQLVDWATHLSLQTKASESSPDMSPSLFSSRSPTEAAPSEKSTSSSILTKNSRHSSPEKKQWRVLQSFTCCFPPNFKCKSNFFFSRSCIAQALNCYVPAFCHGNNCALESTAPSESIGSKSKLNTHETLMRLYHSHEILMRLQLVS